MRHIRAFASREHVVPGRELALGVALEQEGLDGGGRTIAHEDESGGR